MPYLSHLSEEATAFDVLLAYPKMYEPFADFIQEVLRGDGKLAIVDRELIFAYVSRLNACEYCFGGHSNTAYAFGIEDGVFDALMDDIDTAPVDAGLKPLLHYVTKLTRTPARMTRADADAVFEAGWDDEALHSAVALCAMANFMNRLVDGCGLVADPARFEERGREMAEHGYAGRPGSGAGKDGGNAG